MQHCLLLIVAEFHYPITTKFSLTVICIKVILLDYLSWSLGGKGEVELQKRLPEACS
jgi:hypothetical protein